MREQNNEAMAYHFSSLSTIYTTNLQCFLLLQSTEFIRKEESYRHHRSENNAPGVGL
ncbi:unnamed protein product [Camellia sinensis]